MATETERRFLVKSEDWRRTAGAGVQYRQGYLSTDPQRNVRIRTGGGEAALTVKGEANGVSRPEFEYPVPQKDAAEIEKMCLPPVLEKTRYKIKHGGLTWEIDEYAGANQGLIVAEVETTSRISKKPEWVGSEISQDDRYRNSNLAGHPFSEWSASDSTTYCLKAGESLPDGIGRMLDEQLGAAIADLSNEKAPLDTAVHEARKAVKRTRSLLRLIRPAIPKAYERENARLQSVGRDLSELRDAQALIETLEELKEHEPVGSAKAIHEFLRQRKETITANVRRGDVIPPAITRLKQSRRAIGRLDLSGLDFPIVLQSFQTALKRGEKAFERAHDDPEADNFHECRKRVKDLRYQLSLLTELWPGVIDAYADSAKKLEEYLGDDHNLAVLSGILRREQDGSESKPSIQEHIEKRQKKLRTKAAQLSRRLYSEPGKVWTRRLEMGWKAFASG